jgi:RNA polymerase-interacting CarD/CdnL/TRCF family regulator
MLDQARTLLVKELSVAQAQQEDEVASELDALFTPLSDDIGVA